MVVQPHVPGQAHKVPATTHITKLQDLPAAEASNMDWLAKGRWLVQQNAGLLAAAQSRPLESITLVTVLLDLGRDKLGGGFKRTFTEYINRMKAFVSYDLPKVMFLDANYMDDFKPLLDTSPSPVHVIPITKEEVKAAFKGWDALQAIRTNPDWANRQAWLAQSPQATMEYYNPLVMSKVRLARQAAELNPFHTDAFLFVDAGHLCNDPASFSKAHVPFMADNLMNKGMLVTFFDYVPSSYNGEVHGFEAAAFQKYIGDTQLPLRVGRGGVFGGRPEHLAVAEELFELIKAETLAAGYLGTEENYFSILDYRFHGVVQRFDNGEGGNCAVFYYVRSPPRDPEKFGYRLRGATCDPDWKALSARGQPSCTDSQGSQCPPEVDPKYLDDAPQQWTCHEPDKYFCTVACESGKGMDGVKWFANQCGTTPSQPCAAPEGGGDVVDKHVEEDRQAQLLAGYDDPGPEDGIDLRGLVCGRKPDGAVRCRTNDPFDAEECPPSITPDSLTAAQHMHLCQPKVKSHFCTVTCNPLSSTGTWHPHDIAWCKANPGSCPPMPRRIPKDQWSLGDLPASSAPVRVCNRRAASTAAGVGALRGGGPHKEARVVPELSIGMLVYGSRELQTLEGTLQSYEKNGLLSGVSEFMVWMNKRDARLNDLLAPWAARFPAIRLMGNAENHGIVLAFNWMAGNASSPFFLFLEKDFRMIEPWDCGYERLAAGVQLLKDGTAHAVRYRHRWRAGSPNWAKTMFKGQENRVFKQQPNLFCNHFHWLEHPERRWPDKIWFCAKQPYFYCSDSEFCNWTNNPTMISTAWWKREYVDKFSSFQHHSPYKDIEFYMNWEPHAWNDRKWIVAQGDGLFRHEDYMKWG